MRKNILILDDDESIRELVTFYLEQSGFGVRSVGDGLSAFEELRNNHFDLILLDIALPHMNGVSLLRTLRGIRKFEKLPVIMLTASGEKDDILNAKRYDISDYVVKPPMKDDLLNRVERVLGGRPQYFEIRLDASDGLSHGLIEVPARVVSISYSGLILFSPVPVPKKYVLEHLNLGLLHTLNIEQAHFAVTDCVPLPDGGFELYVPFLGLSKTDQVKLREWILQRTVSAREPNVAVSPVANK